MGHALRRLPHLNHTLRTPGRARSALVRRLVALAFILAAGLSFLAERRAEPEVLVFAGPVAPGTVLAESDLTFARLPAELIPDAALRDETPASLAGSVVVAAADAGELVTPARLLGPDLTAAFAPAGTQVSDPTKEFSSSELHMVPLSLAEPDVVPLLHHGDEVSIISPAADDRLGGTSAGAAPDPTRPGVPLGEAASVTPVGTLVAAGGRVVSTGLPEESARGSGPGTILIALPASDAERVAALSLTVPLTVVLTGPRAAGSRG